MNRLPGKPHRSPSPRSSARQRPERSIGLFAQTMQTYRERLQDAARELAAHYDTIKSETQRRLGTLFNASDSPTTLDGLCDLEVSYPTIKPPNYLRPASIREASPREPVSTRMGRSPTTRYALDTRRRKQWMTLTSLH